jgi:myosin heavy subunit
MDSEVGYKRGCGPMAASFGVTGGLRNPYLLNINTEGVFTDRAKEIVNQKHIEQIQSIANTAKNEEQRLIDEHERFIAEHDKMMKKNTENMVVSTWKQQRNNTKQEEKIGQLAEQENLLETKKGELAKYEEEEHEAKETFNAAQKRLNEATKMYKTTLQEHKDLQRKVNELHDTITNSETVSRSSRSTDSKATTVENITGTGNHTVKKGGLFSAFKRGLNIKAENELDLENIAHFSAPRENRCTYI